MHPANLNKKYLDNNNKIKYIIFITNYSLNKYIIFIQSK